MKKFKTLLIVMLLTILLLPIRVFADPKPSDVTFSIIGGPGTAKQNQAFSVKIEEKGANDSTKTVSAYNLKITFDSSMLQYTGGGTSIEGNTITVSGGALSADATVAELTFNVLGNAKAESTNITLATAACNVNGEDTTCKTNSASVKVAALGTDSTLSGLSIPNTPLTPAFNKNTKEYSANVKDVTQLTVNATSTDPNASIQITDNRNNLQKGNNEIVIVVTSENGAKQTRYKINVNAEFTPTEEELMKANASLSVLEIKGQKIDFNQEEVKYYLDVAYDIKELEVTATAVNPNAQVQVSGNDKLIVGKNTVNIVVTAEDTTTTKTYSIMVTRLPENKKIIKTCPDTTSTKEWIIFSVGLFLTFTLGIVLGYILCKNQVLQKIFKKKEKVEEPVEIQSLSDTIDLSDTIEEIKDEEDVKKA